MGEQYFMNPQNSGKKERGSQKGQMEIKQQDGIT